MKAETIRACSIWRALEVVGDVPVLLIMERAFLGTNRFELFVEQTSLPRSVVSARLKKLVENDCLARIRRLPARRHVYVLTTKGRDLFGIALMMLRWQHRWEPRARDFRVDLVHRSCGGSIEPVPVCAACDAEIDPRAVSWREGPGLAQVTPTYGRRRRLTEAVAGRRSTGTLIDTVIELFGDRWATLVVRAAFTGIHRFDDIQRDTLMATNILAGRIERLVAQGILRAVPYSNHPDRFDYKLTEKGLDLYPVILGLLQWGDRWYADERGPPLLLSHVPCGHDLKMRVTCSGCGGELTLDNSSFAVMSRKNDEKADG